MVKKSFVTGLIILLPIAVTLAVIVFIFNLLTTPFLGVVKSFLERYHLFENGFFLLNAREFQTLIAQVLILFTLIGVTIGLGIIARWFFFRSLVRLAEYIVQKIPFVSAIYRTCQDVVQTIFTSKTKSFKQVVLVKFPSSQAYTLGLITREEMPLLREGDQESSIAVFVPTTPNPTSGFLVMYKQEDLLYLDMKVEDAFKYIISCGVIVPPFTVISKADAFLRQVEMEGKL